jgi:lysophospholipase L1-like esterase
LLPPTVLVVWAAIGGLPVRRDIPTTAMRSDGGLAFSVAVDALVANIALLPIGDDRVQAGTLGPTRIYEDGVKLGPARRESGWISEHGLGSYAHRDGRLHFSSTDRTDPRTNGRAYRARLRRYASAWWAVGFVSLFAVSAIIAAAPYAHSLGSLRRRRPTRAREPIGVASIARRLASAAVAIALASFVGSLLDAVRGAGFWAVATVAAGFVVAALGLAIPATRRVLAPATLALASFGFTLAMSEIALAIYAQRTAESLTVASEPREDVPTAPPARLDGDADPRDVLPAAVRARIPQRLAVITMPAEWMERAVEIPGARKALYWHDVLHVYDVNQMRRTEPFPPKQPDRPRIVILGDSLTYGWGIEPQWSYPSQLERALASNYDVEVLNLGVPGHASEEVLSVAARFLPRLDPDLVIYGVCLNDFLPAEQGQYDYRDAYSFPIPEAWKDLARKQTRVAGIVETGYDRLLRRVGLRVDFYDDILRDFGDYQERFVRDVAAINALAVERGLPPVIAMVLDQAPIADGRGHRVARIAESLLAEAGLTVVATDEFYRRYDGESFAISRWEGHPNEEGMAIFSAMLAETLEASGLLEPGRKSP